MDPICTATTSSGKKCTRCVEKHGVKYCWQHAKTPKRSSPKKASPKKGSPKKMSPKRPEMISHLGQILPKDVLINHILLKMSHQELNSTCKTNKRIAAICKDPNFRQRYEAIHGRLSSMFVGRLVKIGENRGLHEFHDDLNNRLKIVKHLERGVIEIEYIPNNQFYGIQPPDIYKKLSIQAFKSGKKWNVRIQRDEPGTGRAWTGEGHMEDIKNFLRSIGKERWFDNLRTKDYRGLILLSPKYGEEFVNIIKNEMKKHSASRKK
jgi:hypothetical protein